MRTCTSIIPSIQRIYTCVMIVFVVFENRHVQIVIYVDKSRIKSTTASSTAKISEGNMNCYMDTIFVLTVLLGNTAIQRSNYILHLAWILTIRDYIMSLIVSRNVGFASRFTVTKCLPKKNNTLCFCFHDNSMRLHKI